MSSRLKAREVEALTFMQPDVRGTGDMRAMRPPRIALGIGAGVGFLALMAWFIWGV
jgi:hypothetical protein